MRPYFTLTLLNEIFAPGPALRDELERGRSNGARTRSQRSKHDLDLRYLDLGMTVEPECLRLGRRTMPHCSFEIRMVSFTSPRSDPLGIRA